MNDRELAYWKDQKIEDMTREELVEALKWLSKLYDKALALTRPARHIQPDWDDDAPMPASILEKELCVSDFRDLYEAWRDAYHYNDEGMH